MGWGGRGEEIQFIEFMGGYIVPQAFQNYFMCWRFIRISTITIFKCLLPGSNSKLYVATDTGIPTHMHYFPCSIRASSSPTAKIPTENLPKTQFTKTAKT